MAEVPGEPGDLGAALERALGEVCRKLWNVRFSCVGPTRGMPALAIAG